MLHCKQTTAEQEQKEQYQKQAKEMCVDSPLAWQYLCM